MIGSPLETEYFAREDAERLRKLAHRIHLELEEAERQRLRALHWMRCPKCGMQMQEVMYRGMTVDVCFSCNGLFLDEGELAHLQKPESKGMGINIEEGLQQPTRLANWPAPEQQWHSPVTPGARQSNVGPQLPGSSPSHSSLD